LRRSSIAQSAGLLLLPKRLQSACRCEGREDWAVGRTTTLPILHELISEVESFFMEVHVPKAKEDNPCGPYGDPLAAKGKSCRYFYWPSKRKVFPLLYFCALQLLGGRCATVTNERIHSPATRITKGLRGCLKPEKTERLTLSFFFLREEVKALVAKIPPLPGHDPFDFDEAAVIS
jgi:hypothetical protein